MSEVPRGSEECARKICEVHDNRRDEVLTLHDVQDAFGFVIGMLFAEIAEALNLSRPVVYGDISFYHDFREISLNGT